MSTRPKFDPDQVQSLLSRGTAEARGTAEPRGTGRPSPTVSPIDSTAVVSADRSVANEDDAEANESAQREKRAITVRLSDEVLSALYRHQAELRCAAGARLRDTTIGGVIDTLLRKSLKLAH